MRLFRMGEEDKKPKDESLASEPTTPQTGVADSEIDLLRARVAELENTANAYKDQLLRKAAEFENYKRRVENDYAQIVKFAGEDVIIKLLPVLDDFERSLKAMREGKVDSKVDVKIIDGVELVYGKLRKMLEAHGLRPFESVGLPFDPEYHDALLQIPKNDVAPHTVVEEIDKGYKLHDKVIRHARVIVSAEAPMPTEIQSPAGNNEEAGSK